MFTKRFPVKDRNHFTALLFLFYFNSLLKNRAYLYFPVRFPFSFEMYEKPIQIKTSIALALLPLSSVCLGCIFLPAQTFIVFRMDRLTNQKG